MESRDETIEIEVVYALPGHQAIRKLHLPRGTTVKGAVERSGIPDLYPDIDFARNKLGIFGKLVDRDKRLRAGDRVEIYRPLARDPKEIRRERARLRRNTTVAETDNRSNTA